MKSKIAFLLSFILTLNNFSIADTSDDIIYITQSKSNFVYADHMYKISHLLRVNEGELFSNAKNMPSTTEEAHEYFEKVCAPRSSTEDMEKNIRIKRRGFITTSEFNCNTKSEETGDINTVQFVVTVDNFERLKDLQINKLNSTSDKLKLEQDALREGAEIAIAVGSSILVSGLMAKEIYQGQNDKVLHAIGGSLVAAATTLIAYYGLHVTKNQAAIIGLASAIAVGLLKEYAYDAHRRNSHTVDNRDALATGLGGATGAFFIRWKFQW